MEEKKIMFLLGGLTRGGAERVISILSQDYARNGWTTNICLLLSPKIEYPLDATTRVIDLSGKQNISRLMRVPFWLKEIRRIIKIEKPDYIIAFVARINILVLLASIGLDSKIIVSERNDPRFDGRGLCVRILTNILYPGAYYVVFQTRRAQKYFNERIKKNSCIIPNPIYISDISNHIKKKKIVNVGRLSSQKNQFILLKSFSRILPTHEDYQLEIFGDGELKDELIGYTIRLGIHEHVKFHGIVQNIHESIADAELFVLSSNYEGLSNSLLEAMMMGLACISTECGGSDEYIHNGENGILIPVRDEEALVSAMMLLLDDKNLRNKIGENAAKSVKHLEENNICSKWNELTK